MASNHTVGAWDDSSASAWRGGDIPRPEDTTMSVQSLTDEQRDLVAKHVGLAGAVAKAYGKGSHLDFEERLSAASAGLCRAALSFDGEKSRFSTYGTIAARQAVRLAIQESYVIRIGPYQYDCLSKGVEPKGELSAQMRRQAEKASRVRRLPFNGHYVPDRRGPSAQEIAEQEEFCASLLRHLGWRYRLVVRQCVMRGRKLREVGSMLGVTTERARQLRNEGLTRLREIMEERDL
jgi:RNA polymerase sigma factor (sigma-70 family)